MITRKAAVLVLALAGAAWPAAAQQQQGQPGGMMGACPMMESGMMRGPGMMMQMPTQGMGRGCMMGTGPMMMGGPGQHIEGRLAFLKTELGITPAQEQVWNAYAEAFRASASAMQGMHEQMMSGGMPASAPERMRRHEQMMSARLDALKKLNAAASPLYDALSPQQKERADALLGMM